jgi:hypothetical protein
VAISFTLSQLLGELLFELGRAGELQAVHSTLVSCSFHGDHWLHPQRKRCRPPFKKELTRIPTLIKVIRVPAALAAASLVALVA